MTLAYDYEPSSATGSTATVNVTCNWALVATTPLLVLAEKNTDGAQTVLTPSGSNPPAAGAYYVDAAGDQVVCGNPWSGTSATFVVLRLTPPAQEFNPHHEGVNLAALTAQLDITTAAVQELSAAVFGKAGAGYDGLVLTSFDPFRVAVAEVRANKVLGFDADGDPDYLNLPASAIDELTALDALGVGIVKKTSNGDPPTYSALASTAFGEALINKPSATFARLHLAAQTQYNNLDAIGELSGAGYARRASNGSWTLVDGIDEDPVGLGHLAYLDGDDIDVDLLPDGNQTRDLGSVALQWDNAFAEDVWAARVNVANSLLMGDGTIGLLAGDSNRTPAHDNDLLAVNLENEAGSTAEFLRLLAADANDPDGITVNQVKFAGLPEIIGIGQARAVNVWATTAVKLGAGGVRLLGGTVNHADDVLAFNVKTAAAADVEFARMLAATGSDDYRLIFGNSTNIEGVRKVIFEGTTDDSKETTLAAAEPSADQTITLPNLTPILNATSGTVMVEERLYTNPPFKSGMAYLPALTVGYESTMAPDGIFILPGSEFTVRSMSVRGDNAAVNLRNFRTIEAGPDGPRLPIISYFRNTSGTEFRAARITFAPGDTTPGTESGGTTFHVSNMVSGQIIESIPLVMGDGEISVKGGQITNPHYTLGEHQNRTYLDTSLIVTSDTRVFFPDIAEGVLPVFEVLPAAPDAIIVSNDDLGGLVAAENCSLDPVTGHLALASLNVVGTSIFSNISLGTSSSATGSAVFRNETNNFFATLRATDITGANKDIEIPNGDGTLALLELAQTWTAAQTFNEPVTVVETRWHDQIAASVGRGPTTTINADGSVSSSDGDTLHFPINLLPGSIISRLRVKWQGGHASDGVSFRLVKRDESGTTTALTAVGATTSPTGSAVAVTEYDVADETVAADHSYSLEVAMIVTNTSVTVFAAGVQTSTLKY